MNNQLNPLNSPLINDFDLAPVLTTIALDLIGEVYIAFSKAFSKSPSTSVYTRNSHDTFGSW